MEETKFVKGLKFFGQSCLSFCLATLLLCLGATAFAQNDEDIIWESSDPVLISASDSTRALAANADNWRGVAVPRKNSEVFQPGARVVLFITNLDLIDGEGANAFRVYAEDASGKLYRFAVEDLQPLRKQNWIYALTVRLQDEIGYWGQPASDGDVLIRVSWRGNTSNKVRLGLGTTGGKIKDEEGAAPTPAPAAPPTATENVSAETYANRKRFMEQAAFGPTPALDLRLRQIGFRRWIEEQAGRQPTFPYPDFPLKNTNVDAVTGCPANVPSGQPDPIRNQCIRDHYNQYQNQKWMLSEALYGEDQLRRRVSWALHQIWVVSGVDTQQQRHLQEYYEILDRNAFGNYRKLMEEMTLNPAMGNYLDMIRSTRTNPNENYPREILQLFSIGLDMLNLDGTPQLDNQGNRIPTYDQEKINQFTKVFTGWQSCQQNPPVCPNAVAGITNYIDPMLLITGNHDLTAKTLFNYPGAPNPTIAACTGCTGTAITTYANNSLRQTLDNIYGHPNVAPFISKLLIQHLITSEPSPAYVARVATVFNNNRLSDRQMLEVVKAILLDPEARGSRKTDPNYGKLREPVQFVSNFLRTLNVKASGNVTINGVPTPPPASCGNRSDGVLMNVTNAMGQNVWNPPTVFNYFPPDYVVPGTDVLGPEFAITNTGTSFARINQINTLVFGQIGFQAATANNNNSPDFPCGTSIDLTEPTAWATTDATGNLLIENLNARMLHGTMSQAMKDKIRTAISVAGMTAAQKAQQAIYLVATSSQYQVQK